MNVTIIKDVSPLDLSVIEDAPILPITLFLAVAALFFVAWFYFIDKREKNG